MIGNAPNQRLGVQHLVLTILAKSDVRDEMRVDGRDADCPHLRIAGYLAARVRLGAKVGSIVCTVGRPEGRAVHGPKRQPLPVVALGILPAPGVGRLMK